MPLHLRQNKLSMKKIFFLGSFLVFLINFIFSQNNFTDLKSAYERLDITKVSGNVVFMINEEMKRIDSNEYKKFILAKRQAVYRKYNLVNPAKQRLFLNNYNQRIRDVRLKYLKDDILMRVNPNIISNYGADVLSRYGGNNSSVYLNGLLQPIIKARLSQYTNQKISEGCRVILTEPKIVDSLTKFVISYWKASGERLSVFLADTNFIKQKVLRVISEINSDERLKNFIQSSIDPIVENIKINFEEKWNNVVNVIYSESNNYKRKFLSEYQKYSSSVKDFTENEFKKVGASIDSLLTNESKVYRALNNIQTDWKRVKTEIEQLEGRMKDLKDNPKQLGDILKKHSELVAQNFIRHDLINKYVNKGVEVVNTISFIKSEVYDRIVDPEKRGEFINSLSLDNLSLPTLSTALASAAGFASKVSATFPNCKPLQDVAEVANYVMSAVNIGMGVAELCSFNPIGLINIFTGLSGLFGGKPEPSPEMKMMQQMMTYMQEQFKHLNEHLVYIEEQIANLTELVKSMYQDMMKSFKVVNDKLDLIEWETKTLYQMNQSLIFGKLGLCNNLEARRVSREGNVVRSLDTYEDVYSFYAGNRANVVGCLPILNQFSNDLMKDVFSFSFTGGSLSFTEGDARNAYLVDKDIFQPMKELFLSFHGNDCNAINALGIPSRSISENGQNYFGISEIRNCLGANYTSTFSIYYNYAALSLISNLLIAYSNFYLLEDETQPSYFPKTILGFLQLPSRSIKDRFDNVRNNLEFMLTLVNRSIAQQSLISGNNVLTVAYNYILGSYNDSQPNSTNVIENAIYALENNKLFAKNFAGELIYSAINKHINSDKIRAKRFTDLYFTTGREKLDSLNKEFFIPMVKFDLDNVEKLVLRIKGRGREFIVPVPQPTFIIENEMAQSDGLYLLLAAKEKIIDKLIDLSFFTEFSPPQGLNVSDYKYLIQDLNN